ncbi:MAG TPA: LptA/OstA family protein [Phenylobacterium sp.]|nr:LptA/OstA family protein [Phenylobacterium sp.]
MKSLIAMAALAAAVLAVQPAAAQSPKNSKAPFDVSADQLETHSADCVAIYSGSAEALQAPATRLRADTMIAHLEVTKGAPKVTTASAGAGCGAMTTIEAKGNVYYVSGDGRRVHGDNGFYDAASTTITITGDVTAVDGQNVMRGTKMVYNTDTGEGHVEGGGKGPNAKNRPRGVFYPKDSSSDAATPDAKPKKAAK